MYYPFSGKDMNWYNYSNCGTISNTILVEFITGSANASAAFL